MCGIIAYLTTIQNYETLKSIIESLKILQNRGYDSSGVGIYDEENNTMVTKKIVGKNLYNLFDLINVKKSYFGMGHNRWSTHGIVNEINAHPHHSLSGKFHIVHNGTIDNMKELMKLIPDYKTKKYSTTDTELFINLIEYHYMLEKKGDFKKAVQTTINLIKGPFAICVFSTLHPETVLFCRRDLPLLVGFSENLIIASSESIGFYNQVDHYIELQNNTIFESQIIDKNVKNINIDKYIKKRVVKSKEPTTPYPYPFWTIKEIMEQPLTVMKSMNMGMRIKNIEEVRLNGLDKKMEQIISCKKALLFGCGTSFHAGLVGNHLFKIMKCFEYSESIIASEFDFDIHTNNNMKNTLCIYLSQSGETKDLVDVLNITEKTNAVNISIVNTINSLIATTTGSGVYVNASRENGVASTKSFTAQVVVLALTSIYINQYKYKNDKKQKLERIKMISSLQDLPLDIESSFAIFPYIKSKIIPELITKKNSLFILGSGLGYYIAREGALKIKEISYIHAEAYSLLDLKHGPFALIENNTPIIVIAHDEKSHERSKNICSEIKTRNGFVIFISPYENIPKTDCYIQVPYNPKFSFLLCLIPLQIMAYELALIKNLNPDFPKNLAKCVTVN